MNSFNMTSSLKYPFCLLLTTLVLSMSYTHAHITTKNNDNDDLITTMCHETIAPSICETDIRSDPRRSKPDKKTVVLIIIDVTRSQFLEALTYTKNVTESAHDPGMIRALNKCIEIYNFVVDVSSRSAIAGIETGQPKYAYDAMKDAADEAAACLKAFPDNPPVPFVDRTRALKQTSAIAVKLVELVM
ncbi:hypothetical protein RND81_01G063900 [Saponaria officinalis]|uniref:Pectinesterase inhibitor domain-containing protein n=1 Tax=Saponaria officinalis TaxID=3572 RepID=A0AAW1NCI3_SAPOF